MNKTELDTYVAECTRIDDFDLDAEYIRVPSDIAYWSARYSDVYRHWLEMKLAREILFAQLYSEHHQRLQMTSKGRVTVGEVEACVVTDPSYIDAKAKEIVADGEKVRLSGVLDALQAKRECIIGLGANRRAEMQRDPLIRKDAQISREINEAKR